ncbi:LPS assembly lipoprotein LptE [Rhodoferax sp.]|uniref:LPS-assembly lipoprotein LptE n=1 Tax=Rhodoferax sp. TaxID=50421 RepID=UPI00283AE1ED|nr:LPS assembly lipoprotein LptE [Rhodoferax sp.]MDR3369093.1 LPS assembly lipoprotein LptE [Rhodoferax sp.]
MKSAFWNPSNLPRRSLVVALVATSLLAGCGFKLRGSQNFAFSSIAIQPDPGGAVVQELRRSFGGTVQVLSTDVPVAQAQVVLKILGEQREKVVVGVNSSGQVLEFQLRLRVRFRLDTPQGKELIAENEIMQQREVSYSESAALAKETEMANLYVDMERDIAQQIQRRLAAVKQFQ